MTFRVPRDGFLRMAVWRLDWHHRVAVKELNLSYYKKQTVLFTIYPEYGNLRIGGQGFEQTWLA